MDHSLGLALCSTLIFAGASIIFAIFAKKASALWMNAFKATVALLAFAVASLLTSDWNHLPELDSFLMFFLSGFIGLNIGDFFLLKAFQRIGSARTLVIFSFQPLLMATFAYLVFGQALGPQRLVAVFILMACVLVVSYERFRADGKWELLGPLFAFTGVLLDCFGILMTRQGFDLDPNVTVIQANFYRCLGAGMGFLVLAQFFPFQFTRRFKRFPIRMKALVLGASFGGTFVALWMYLSALEVGHLAKITAVVGSGPLFTAAFESILYKKWPSKYLWLSLVLFACGFLLLI
jgi:drug/metabolite transporter (DMT)-like permease